MHDISPHHQITPGCTKKAQEEKSTRARCYIQLNAATPCPLSLATTLGLQPKLEKWKSPDQEEGSTHNTYPQKRKGQEGPQKLSTHQSTQLCRQSPGKSHQCQIAVVPRYQLPSRHHTKWAQTAPKHRGPAGLPSARGRKCLPREEKGPGSLLRSVKGL